MKIGERLVIEVCPRAWVVGVFVGRKIVCIYLLCVAIGWTRSWRPFGPV